MTRTKIILLVAFLLTFAAGASVGLLVSKPAPSPQHRSPLAELNLTAQQRDEVRIIWDDLMGPSVRQQRREREESLAVERDKAIASLFTDAQRSQHDAIQQDYARKMEELSQQRQKAFDEVIKRTRAILTPGQALQYDEIVKKQKERAASGPAWGYGRRHRGAPASRPATQEQTTPLVAE